MPTSNEPGTPAAEGFISLSVPEIAGNEWEYVKQCLDTGWVSSVGPFVDRFEGALADYVGVDHAVATVNGTAALHVALLVAGVEPDDEVLVSDLTFIAPVNAIRYAHAWPVFIDAEPDFWQMNTQKVVDFLENDCSYKNDELRNKVTGRRVTAVLPVHILGHPVDMDPIVDVARRYGLVVIEDATESLGARYKERRTGCLGDIACFSFNGNKIITTGGGGMIVTDRAEWAAQAKYLTTQAKDDPVEYIHGQIGYNYRLTNVQAAIGCAQLEQLDAYISAKRSIAAGYNAALADVPGITLMREAAWAHSIYWMYTVLVHKSRYGKASRALMASLAEEHIQSRPLWLPVHLNAPYQSTRTSFDYPVAEDLNRHALSLPCSVGLTDSDQQRVINHIVAGVSS